MRSSAARTTTPSVRRCSGSGSLRRQASPSAYYGYDRSTLNLANVNDVGAAPDASLGGVTYPLNARWWAEDAQRNHYFGATLNQRLGRVRLELAGNYTESRGTTDFNYRVAHGARLAEPRSLPGDDPSHHFRVGNAIRSDQRSSLRSA